MEKLRVIDSDTHVDETEATWDYMRLEEEAFKPRRGTDPETGRGYWLVDGYKVQRANRSDSTGWTTVKTRELLDVAARLRHMDELGVEVHVIYPTMFNRNPAARPEVELSLTRSYNRWLADKTAQSAGRMRWICVPPLRNMPEALAELRFARDHGACGVLKKGDLEADHEAYDPYFFPLYEEAERLDMPICFHQGTGRRNSLSGYRSRLTGALSRRLPSKRSFGITQRPSTVCEKLMLNIRRHSAALGRHRPSPGGGRHRVTINAEVQHGRRWAAGSAARHRSRAYRRLRPMAGQTTFRPCHAT